MKKDHANLRYAILFILIVMIFLAFGCATMKQKYEDVSQKAKNSFAKEEQKPVVVEEPEDLGVVYKIKQFLPVKLAPSA